MFVYIYNLWNFYNYLVAIHGIYVAYSLFLWSYQNICFICTYILPQHPSTTLQINDK